VCSLEVDLRSKRPLLAADSVGVGEVSVGVEKSVGVGRFG